MIYPGFWGIKRNKFFFITTTIMVLLLQQETMVVNAASFVVRHRHHSSPSSSLEFSQRNGRSSNNNDSTTTTTTLQAFKKKKKKQYGNRNDDDEDDDKKTWTYNPLDVNDLSPLDTLLRRGFIPFSVRLTQNSRYEEAVLNYMEKDGCNRATAQRNMDAYFCDPNGWVISKQRTKNLGEDFGDINGPTGVQKRPLFSLIWGAFSIWVIFSYFPAKIAANGGIRPTGFCMTERVKTADGKKICPKYTPNIFRSMDDQTFLNQVLIEESKTKAK